MPILSAPPSALAPHIDHTLLRADANQAAIEKLCHEACFYGFRAVCVNPYWLSFVRQQLSASTVRSCVVLDFPLGASPLPLKQAAARYLSAQGADELDMVVNLGALSSGDLATVKAEVEAVRQAAYRQQNALTLKVIIETGLLDEAVWEELVLLVAEAGADYIKTSSGFGPRGVSCADVQRIAAILRRRAVSSSTPALSPVYIKASGGIRSLAEAQALLAAGADCLGSSAGVELLAAEAQQALDHSRGG